MHKSFMVICSITQGRSSRVSTQQISNKPTKDEPIGSGCELQVVIGERRSFGPAWIDHPNRTAFGLKFSKASNRIGYRVRVAMRDNRVTAEKQ